MNKNAFSIVAIIIGVVLLGVAVVYFITPAQSLPAFFPGYAPELMKHHVTHGVAALGLGIGAFAVAWMNSGKKTTSENK